MMEVGRVSMQRFVILVHDHPFQHWDLLLEFGGSCRTWRLLADPDSISETIPAENLSDHRLMYLEYEGPVSGERGIVSRWDGGTFKCLIDDPGLCEVVFNGQRWTGVFRLKRDAGDRWTCCRQR